MDTKALYDKFRSEVNDTKPDFLWKEDEVYGYIDEAQKMFCRLTGGLADSSSPLTLIKAKEGVKWASVSPRILKIRMASLVATDRPLTVLNFEDREIGPARFTTSDYGNLNTGLTLENDNLPGPIRALVTNEEENRVRWIQVPTEDQDVRLVTYRLPKEDIKGNSACLEINEQHHYYLLHWMKHLAYAKEDAETYDRGKSIEHDAKFRQYCAEAKSERERREHKYREVQYGGIPMS